MLENTVNSSKRSVDKMISFKPFLVLVKKESRISLGKGNKIDCICFYKAPRMPTSKDLSLGNIPCPTKASLHAI